MASYTNNNVTPQNKALSNAYPGAKPLSLNNAAVLKRNQYSTPAQMGNAFSLSGISQKNTPSYSPTTATSNSTSSINTQTQKPLYNHPKAPVFTLDASGKAVVENTQNKQPSVSSVSYSPAESRPSVPQPKTATQNQNTTSNVSTTPNQPISQPTMGSYQYDLQHGIPTGTSSSWNKDPYSQPNTQGYVPTPSMPNQAIPNQQSYPSYVTSLANQQNSPYNLSARGSIQDLRDISAGNQQYADRARQIADIAGSKIEEIGQQGARGEAGHLSKGTSPVSQGMAGLISRTAAAQQQAVSQGANMQLAGNAQGLTAQGQAQSGYGTAAGQALTGQGQAQSALGTAAGYASPDANTAFYGNPLTGGIYGQGQDIVSNSINNAIQLVRNGASVNDPNVQALLSPYGAVGQAAFQQAMLQGGNYNPTAQAAQVAQNVSFGQQTQNAAQNLNLALQSLKPVQQMAVNFLQQSGINPSDAPVYNAPINQYIATLGNPAAATQWAGIKNEIQTYANQILSAKQSANLPTTQDEQLASQDPGNLSARGLQAVFDTWDTLGGTNVNVLNRASQGAYGGTTGYTGQTPSFNQNIQASPVSSAPGSGLTNPVAQGAAGVGLKVLDKVEDIPGSAYAIGAGLLKLLK